MILKLNGTPVTWPISSYFGDRDAVHTIPHDGVDFALNLGTPVPSLSDGVVYKIVDDGALHYGKAVEVHMQNGDTVLYGHLSEFKCNVGQVLHQGDLIGLVGSTGKSTGPHLHVGVYHAGQAVDPMVYFHMSGDTGTTGFASLDHLSEVWKHNAMRIFHLPGESVQSPGFGVTEYAQKRVLDWFAAVGHALNQNSAEIATFAVLICAFGVIIAPLIGSHPQKWYGRMAGAFFGGVIWRIGIQWAG
jgi:murein DD-endopeptidase MepM/ murein hydrolase activator NlpD